MRYNTLRDPLDAGAGAGQLDRSRPGHRGAARSGGAAAAHPRHRGVAARRPCALSYGTLYPMLDGRVGFGEGGVVDLDSRQFHRRPLVSRAHECSLGYGRRSRDRGRPAQEDVVVPSRCAVARGLATPRVCCAGAFVVFGPGYGWRRPARPKPAHAPHRCQPPPAEPAIQPGGDPWLDRTRSMPLPR